MTYQEIPLTLSCNMNSKSMQLFLILLYYGKSGMSRHKLLAALYGQEEPENSSNNLRATVFRLRKFLALSGLPKDNYVRIQNGIYDWGASKTEVVVDALEFEKSAILALETKEEDGQLSILKTACNQYRGEFLPMLAIEEWVSEACVRYQELYFSCLREACRQMKQRREYEDMLELCTIASNIYPFEEWQILQIDCLMAMNRYKEALKAYEHATGRFFEELGLSPSEKMLARFRAMSGQLYYATGAITDIKNSLREKEWIPGAYFCNYPSFIDSYRLIVRMTERTSQSIFLMLCTITDSKGIPMEAGKAELPNAVEHLHSAIGRSLRRGDLYTRYSPNQFLILLIGMKQEDHSVISDRIERNFIEGYPGKKIQIHFYLTSAADMETPESLAQFENHSPE